MPDPVAPETPAPTSVIGAATAPAVPDPSVQPEARSLGETIYGKDGDPSPAAADPASEVAAGDPPAVEGEQPAAEPAKVETAEPPKEGEPAPVDWATAEITLPEGMTVDDSILGGFRELAAATKLDQPTAQKFIDLYTKALTNGQQTIVDQLQTNWTNTQSQWVGEINAMPEFQGEQKAKSEAAIGTVLEEFGGPGIREAFELTGAGNNPAIVRMILNLSSALLEGEPTPVGAPTGQRKQNRTLGQRIYGDNAA